MGSALLFRHPDRDPTRSINFVTAHDGFTLNDLVSYNAKHNLANGEDNRDGADNNDSWNCAITMLMMPAVVGASGRAVHRGCLPKMGFAPGRTNVQVA